MTKPLRRHWLAAAAMLATSAMAGAQTSPAASGDVPANHQPAAGTVATAFGAENLTWHSGPVAKDKVAPTYLRWQLLAKGEADRIAPALIGNGPWRLELDDPAKSSAFLDAFPKMLTSELVARGVAMSTAADAGKLVLTAQVRPLDDRRYQPGTFSLVAAGLWALSLASPTVAGMATLGMVGADAGASLEQLRKDGGTELALTLRAEKETAITASTTGVYLVLGLEHFKTKEQPAAAAVTLPVAAPTTTLHFVR